jgi:hypothetical protein
MPVFRNYAMIHITADDVEKDVKILLVPSLTHKNRHASPTRPHCYLIVERSIAKGEADAAISPFVKMSGNSDFVC